MNDIIQDYGSTVDPEVYIRALQGHQYIPQADQCIRNIVHAYGVASRASELSHIRILDIGCGPGRLTFRFAHRNASVLGVDISGSFIEYANRLLLTRELSLSHDIGFQRMDFTKDPLPREDKWHVLVAQGVLHHLHGEDRPVFIKRCHDVLADDGILVVGDEFIPIYDNEEERMLKVTAFYYHIIAEATKAGFRELAREEARNLIDDVLSSESGSGYSSGTFIDEIISNSQRLNNEFFRGVDDLSPSSLPSQVIRKQLSEDISFIREMASQIAADTPEGGSSRGDRKISMSDLMQELDKHGFELEEQYEIGPVKQLGGMGVLVLSKKTRS